MSHSKKVAIGHLKRCPLCGALNTKRNRECFVCRWRGEFQYDEAAINQGLEDLLERCPELQAAMQRDDADFAASESIFKRFVHRLLGVFLELMNIIRVSNCHKQDYPEKATENERTHPERKSGA